MLIKRLFLYILLLLFGIYLIVVSTWMNLNSETLTPWFEHQINLHLPKRFSSQIDSVSTGFNHLSMNQLLVLNPATDEILIIQSLDISISFWRLILFQELDFQFLLYEGVVNGRLNIFSPKTIRFNISNLRINHNTVIRKSNLILSDPTITAEGSLVLSSVPSGKIDFDVNELTLTGDSKYTGVPLELPQSRIIKLNGELLLTGNQADIKVNATGDINANFVGKIDINRNIPLKSEFDLTIKASFTPEYQAKLGFIKDIFASYKDTTDKIAIKLTGNLDRPKIIKIAE
jgi:type II secretion system protein N